MKNMSVVNLLYTGGWDSTYRLIELSREEVRIQPIYCLDPGRSSVEQEKSTMQKICTALAERKETCATIFPIIYLEINDIPKDEKITKAYKYICEKVKLGSQYEWLARVAIIYPHLEIGIEKPHGEYSGCVAAIDKFGQMKEEDGIKIIDIQNSSQECTLLFGGFRFPIIDLTELDMVKNIKKWGYEDIMKMIWFCHSPLQDKPCGICRPCRQKMECGMESLLPREAQRRYRIYHLFQKVFGEKIANKTVPLMRKI